SPPPESAAAALASRGRSIEVSPVRRIKLTRTLWLCTTSIRRGSQTASLSEFQPHLDLCDAGIVDLSADSAEIGVGDVGLDPAEDHRVEDVEDLEADPEPGRADANVAADAQVLVERARIAQIEGERARRVAVDRKSTRLNSSH